LRYLTDRPKQKPETNKESTMLTLFRRSSLTGLESNNINSLGLSTEGAQVEWVYYIALSELLTTDEMQRLLWLLAETYDPKGLSGNSLTHLHPTVIEIGPRLNFETPWGSTARGLMHNMWLDKVVRIERARRFSFGPGVRPEQAESLFTAMHDRMTEMSYNPPPTSFETGMLPAPVQWIPILEDGMAALEVANTRFGLGMDTYDIKYSYKLFAEILQRNPSDVELFGIGQGNSEHSRHHFFKARLFRDGEELPDCLMDIVSQPYRANPNNSVIALGDDSSAIYGPKTMALVAARPGEYGELVLEERHYHPTLTAETHNHPSRHCPYCGAATGGGGRIRDNQCPGCGGLVIASGLGYCVGNLHLPGVNHPWENDGRKAPAIGASPLEILIEGSNGASEYGTCFGEPVIIGHVRTFGMYLPDGSYRSWIKPIVYTEGVGMIDDRHIKAGDTETGMLIVQIGGPAYRIGIGGGGASSMADGENSAELDFNSVQRGDPEMAQRVNRVMRACVELGDTNPIISAHDLGAGGDSNALPEIVESTGGRINLRAIPVADESLSVLEIWGNESQERNALLIRPNDLDRMNAMCEREGVPVAVVGEVTDDGRLTVFDSEDNSTPVDLQLSHIFSEVPRKTMELETIEQPLHPLVLPEGLTVEEALYWVLRLVSVGSKSWLTRKVDRSVTGLIAQQQCVGPLHTPLCGFAAVAHSHFGDTGTALSQGEKPLVGLISPAAQGRMAVAEALTNLVGAVIEGRNHIKYTSRVENTRCSANWMWAAKLPGEGARLVEAAEAMRDIMLELGMAVDGGKDSLSMASKEGLETVKAPGQLVIAPYAVMPDINLKVTPELKAEGNELLFIDLGRSEVRLGGSALAQVYQQLGDECPDVEDVDMLARAFEVIQDLICDGLIESLHDRSDGGLVVTLVEMAIAGGFGANIDLVGTTEALPYLFNEELGLVLEVSPQNREAVQRRLHDARLFGECIGKVGSWDGSVKISYRGELVISQPVRDLRAAWEDTSMHLEELQTNPACVAEEFTVIKGAQSRPNWLLSFEPEPTPLSILESRDKPRVALVREVGTNGDRELAASLIAAGFSVDDITMTDLRTGRATLEPYRGVVFPGGFSNGDVLDSAKGWAGSIQFDPRLTKQFQAFYERPNTFSYGPCNGAQLMTLLSWAPFAGLPDAQRPRFIRNTSERFESRFPTVQILPSPAIMLQGMEGSQLGVWVAHGEGRLHVPDPKLLQTIIQQGLAPLRYVDATGQPTTQYPFNPNGSPEGITALCSPDGRHLAMMPHPERLANALWQWPWMPESWTRLAASPWLRMFQNAYAWCINN